MKRLDLAATIHSVDFPKEIWAWLDLLGDIIRVTELEARRQEQTFIADTPFKKVLLGGIHSHLSGLKAVFLLLRTELVSQAAGQARLLCEGVISLQCIAESADARAPAFLAYATIEAYEAATALLAWEAGTADPAPVAAITEIRDKLRAEYDALRPHYTSVGKNGKSRRFVNWANRSLADMAKSNPTTKRLYELIYRQMSSYVHGSAWSFRHIPAYTPKYYDVVVVLSDIAQVVMGTAAIWQVFAEYCDRELGWSLSSDVGGTITAMNALSRVAYVEQGA